MQHLRTSDLADVLAFLEEIEHLADDEPFPTKLLGRLAGLVPCDSMYFHERDFTGRKVVTNSWWCRRGDMDESADGGLAGRELWTYILDHPEHAYRLRTAHVGALFLSDFYGRDARRRYAVHGREYHEYWRIRDVATVRGDPSQAPMLCIGLESGSKDFTERDRTVLDLVRPHLAARQRDVRLRRLLNQATAALDALADEDDAPSVVLLGPEGDIEFASRDALRLLTAYLGATGPKMPPALLDWWRSGSRRALVAHRDASCLAVTAVGARRSALLVSEQVGPDVLLTEREWDVMRGVAAGKTNAEIAKLLFVSPATVKKHLEHVYDKLGVRTRTAAVVRLRPRLAHENRRSPSSPDGR